METAVKNRHVAETMLNAKSSRSHSVFTLKIKGVNSTTSETCAGMWRALSDRSCLCLDVLYADVKMLLVQIKIFWLNLSF